MGSSDGGTGEWGNPARSAAAGPDVGGGGRSAAALLGGGGSKGAPPTSPPYGATPPAPAADPIHWPSLIVVYGLTLIAEAARGLMLPTQWPYLLSVGGDAATLGLLIGGFSVGRMAATIPLGLLRDGTSSRTALAVSAVAQVAAHTAYVVAPSAGALVATRVLAGAASANLSVCRAHVARSVPATSATTHLGYLSGLQFVGVSVLPAVGGCSTGCRRGGGSMDTPPRRWCWWWPTR
eukprot:TRINITY_DN11862_c0_g1_i1.p2 TRINITY_DN11862_c0_g1~~TRINITY_DN11862_c0_g1_i1.p2  ORF type:complete len:236 (+),score=34.30 TRINITY_DN11862_c0_g1_i1:212-919(+)